MRKSAAEGHASSTAFVAPLAAMLASGHGAAMSSGNVQENVVGLLPHSLSLPQQTVRQSVSQSVTGMRGCTMRLQTAASLLDCRVTASFPWPCFEDALADSCSYPVQSCAGKKEAADASALRCEPCRLALHRFCKDCVRGNVYERGRAEHATKSCFRQQLLPSSQTGPRRSTCWAVWISSFQFGSMWLMKVIGDVFLSSRCQDP